MPLELSLGEEPVFRFTYVAAFRPSCPRRPLHDSASPGRPDDRPIAKDCMPSRRADTISTAQGAELLARHDSDARTTDVVPLGLPPRSGVDAIKECHISSWLQDAGATTAKD